MWWFSVYSTPFQKCVTIPGLYKISDEKIDYLPKKTSKIAKFDAVRDDFLTFTSNFTYFFVVDDQYFYMVGTITMSGFW